MKRYIRLTAIVFAAAVLAVSLLAGNALAQAGEPNNDAGDGNRLEEMIQWMGPENWGRMVQRMTQFHGAEWTAQMIQNMNEDGACHGDGNGHIMGQGFGGMFGQGRNSQDGFGTGGMMGGMGGRR